MKRLLLLDFAAPVRAGVYTEIHKFCLRAFDCKGCVEMGSGELGFASSQRMKDIFASGFAYAGAGDLIVMLKRMVYSSKDL